MMLDNVGNQFCRFFKNAKSQFLDISGISFQQIDAIAHKTHEDIALLLSVLIEVQFREMVMSACHRRNDAFTHHWIFLFRAILIVI